MIPAPRRGFLGTVHERVRYEDGRWPLWRWDRNLRYLLKSLVQRRTPWTEHDRVALERGRRYLEAERWRSTAPRALRLVLAGDLMWIRDGWADAIAPRLVERIARADLAIANLETPIVPERRVPRLVYETLRYNAPPAFLDPWTRAGAAVLSLCNNHALDQGAAGLARTREVVRGRGLGAIGGLDPTDAITVAEIAGLRVGVTAVTYGLNRPGEPPGVPVERFGDKAHEPDWDKLAALIASARAAGPDLVVLCAHWGFEYEHWPAAVQRAHAVRLIELGVDVIVGSSPHVLQPIEVVSIDGADPDAPLQASRGGAPRFGVIAWSLGNFTTIMPTLPCHVGALVELDLDAALQPTAIRAIPTLSRRGLGAGWLGAATVPAAELDTDEGRAAVGHATAILGRIAESQTDG